MATTSINYSLDSGSNLVSFPFISVEGAAIDTIEGLSARMTQSNAPYSTSLERIIGMNEAASFETGSQEWVGSLQNIDAKRGYWLFLSESKNFTISGELVAPNYPLDMGNSPSHKLVSYPFDHENTISEILNHNSGSNFDAMIGQGSAASFLTASGVWAGSLSTLKTGSAYWVTYKGEANQTINPWNFSASIDLGAAVTTSFDYVKCTDGHTYPGHVNALKELGWSCRYTQYYRDKYNDQTRPLHSFGHPEPSVNNQCFVMIPEKYHGTASLQNADGQEISASATNGPPIIGWFAYAQSGSQSGSLMCIGTSAFRHSPSGSDYWDCGTSKPYLDSFTALHGDNYGREHTTTPLSFYDGNQEIMNAHPPIGAGQDTVILYPRIYDPHRDRVYTAKVYSRLHHETPISMSYGLSSVNFFPYSASGEWAPHIENGSYSNTHYIGWHYIKTDE